MKNKIDKTIKSCTKTYQLTQADRYTFLAYRANLITTKEYYGYGALIASTYQLLDWHSKNQYGIVDI